MKIEIPTCPPCWGPMVTQELAREGHIDTQCTFCQRHWRYFFNASGGLAYQEKVLVSDEATVEPDDRAAFIRAEIEAMDWPEVIGE